MLRQFDHASRSYLSIGVVPVVALVLVLALAGAAVGLAFPKWSAAGLLETPGVVLSAADERQPGANRGPEERALKTQYVTLAEFRKVVSAYSTSAALREYLTATKDSSAAAARLTAQAESGSFWSGVVTPVLPFSRRDAREFGDLKDAASDSLVGLELVTDARTPRLAGEMLGVMAGYFRNALIRERIRAWVLKNQGEAAAMQKAASADIIEARVKIDVMGRRISDFKTILARYPESAKLDARQVVSIADGSDRFLSPLAQLVAAETSITQSKETIGRKERQVRQYALAQRFFDEAEKMLQSTPLVVELVPAMTARVTTLVKGVDPDGDWAEEVRFRLLADISGFSSAFSSFGVRNEARVAGVASRDPLRLAAMGAGAGILLLGVAAFIRASRRAATDDDVELEQDRA